MRDKCYYARRPEINRIVDVSGVVDQIIETNRANRAKGPARNHGSRLRADLARRGQRPPLLGETDVTADRNYIREFILARAALWAITTASPMPKRTQHIPAPGPSAVEQYIQKNAVPNR